MPSQAQQRAPETPELANEDLSIAEMTRLMDVAAAVRKERLTAEQQLNLADTKRLLRERLLESARVTGDPVTEQEIDAAIDAYYARLHKFKPPKPGMETFLASLYVRRGTFIRVALAIAGVAAVWYSVFGLALGLLLCITGADPAACGISEGAGGVVLW